MLLPLWDGLVASNQCDVELVALADRHYSRRNVGSRGFTARGRQLVLRDTKGEVLFVWSWQKFRYDKQDGYNCQIFRNESNRLSSDIILEAEQLAVAKWGPNRFFTYVDPTKITSSNPGACFKHAGWHRIGISTNGKHLLAKEQ
jgi:hypothetical protein